MQFQKLLKAEFSQKYQYFVKAEIVYIFSLLFLLFYRFFDTFLESRKKLKKLNFIENNQ